MFDGHWRSPIERGLAPIGESLRKAGVTADVITIIGILMAGAAAVAIGTGHLRLGLLLLILTGIPDALDGAVAKASGLVVEARRVLRFGVRSPHRCTALRRCRVALSLPTRSRIISSCPAGRGDGRRPC